MPTWNLPPFRDNAVFPQPADFGRWQLADGTLGRLSASLRVDATTVMSDPHEPVRAIPDPWAQARSFAEALIGNDTTHPLYASALAQWRGLLALFALSERYRKVYTLGFRSFALDGPSPFDKVLGHLIPAIAIGERFDLWRKPLLILVNDKPVAMGNPACLVSPGRLTADLMIDQVPWYAAGLRDPLTCDLPLMDLFVLGQWLRQLWRDLATVTGHTAQNVRRLLLDYAVACEQAAGNQPFETELKPSRHHDLGVPYALLFATADCRYRGDPEKTSQTRLRLNPSLALGELKGVILVDAALCQHPAFDPRRTLIWGTTDLASLLNSPQLLASTRAEAADRGWMIVTGDDLFTPRVAQFEGGARIAGNPAGLEDLLLPLRPLALLLDGEAYQSITANAGGGKAIFTLPIRIDDGSELGARLNITRRYATEPSHDEGLLVEIDDGNWNIYQTSLWPDFKSDAWRDYFVRFNYSVRGIDTMVRPVRALSAALIAAEITDQSAGFAAIARLHELNGQGELAERRDRWSRSVRRVDVEFEDIQHATSPFEVIAYVDSHKERGAAPCGFALLALPTRHPEGGDLDVAVDFGTTNTVACFDDGYPIKFADRVIYPLAYADASYTRQMLSEAKWLGRWFFPSDSRDTPTPTVALTRVPYPSEERHHIYRNVIYFPSHERRKDTDQKEIREFSRLASQAKFNLKWSPDAERAEAARDYLQHFVLMVAAEALAMRRDPRRLRWRFSAPDSLGGELRERFENSIQRLVAPFSTHVGSSGSVAGEIHAEGLVAAEFILNAAGFVRGSINIVLDIGGGTTDVTIWDRDRILWIGSFRLAGQNFFTRTISQNPEVLGEIGLGHWQQLFSDPEHAVTGVKPVDIPHLAEMLFSGPALAEAIDTYWDDRLQYSAGGDLRLVAQVFLGGIAWYMGCIVRKLVAEGLSEARLANPAFALCGRGAGIFKKLHAGRAADASSDVTRTLRLFSIASGQETAARLPQLFTTPTKDAKLEVVRGMIKTTGDKQKQAASAARFQVSGLGIELENEQVIAPQDYAGRAMFTARPETVDLAEFREFVNALRDAAQIELDLREGEPQGAWEEIRQTVESEIIATIESDDTKLEMPPPFIIALRSLVSILAMSAKDRDTRLRMGFGT